MKKVLFLILISCEAIAGTITPQSDEARLNMIKNSVSWIGVDKTDFNMLAGPHQKKSHNRHLFDEVFRCTFEEPDPSDLPNGKTPKFWCLDKEGHDFKVKYHTEQEKNSGIYGEILSTRLFWALGFPADATYPVKIICENCPEQPWLF
ncbi:MAG: hypothetical protein D3906_02470 [Candidatus Electrothrix sp. AUS1_2]|nr:hypothetical protein [Candidatus Electrothrix sp. AUS1_2]